MQDVGSVYTIAEKPHLYIPFHLAFVRLQEPTKRGSSIGYQVPNESYLFTDFRLSEKAAFRDFENGGGTVFKIKSSFS